MKVPPTYKQKVTFEDLKRKKAVLDREAEISLARYNPDVDKQWIRDRLIREKAKTDAIFAEIEKKRIKG